MSVNLISAGRIMSRLSKDQDTLDTELANTLWQVNPANLKLLL